MPDCLFCKISSHEIPAKIIHEDKSTIAFLDIHPIAKGHTVVIPKTHAVTVQDLPEPEVSPLFLAVKKVTDKIQKGLQPDGFNIGWNHGQAGGQAVGHLHIHVIPRWKEDGGGSMHSIVENGDGVDLDEVLEKLTSEY